MYAELKKSLRQTYLPTHIYWESIARAAAMVGARHTSSHIWGISMSVATPQIKRRWSSFRGDSMHDPTATAATEGEAEAAAYP